MAPLPFSSPLPAAGRTPGGDTYGAGMMIMAVAAHDGIDYCPHFGWYLVHPGVKVNAISLRSATDVGHACAMLFLAGLWRRVSLSSVAPGSVIGPVLFAVEAAAQDATCAMPASLTPTIADRSIPAVGMPGWKAAPWAPATACCRLLVDAVRRLRRLRQHLRARSDGILQPNRCRPRDRLYVHRWFRNLDAQAVCVSEDQPQYHLEHPGGGQQRAGGGAAGNAGLGIAWWRRQPDGARWSPAAIPGQLRHYWRHRPRRLVGPAAQQLRLLSRVMPVRGTISPGPKRPWQGCKPRPDGFMGRRWPRDRYGPLLGQAGRPA